MTVEGMAHGEDYRFGFCRGTCPEVSQRKLKVVVVSDQTKSSVSATLNVSMSVEKWLVTGCLLKIATNCAVL